MANAVEMSGIEKRYGDLRALANVNLSVEQGSIHALIGENGAGKTTLMHVLYGSQEPDAGSISLCGKPITFQSPAEAIQAGIGMVTQHYSILPELDCLQNLVLGAEGGWRIDRAIAESKGQQLADRMGFTFNWSQDARELSPSAAQKLELLKLLWRGSQVMILDEPTAMLSPSDSDALFGSLKTLVAGGNTVILVTHRLQEVLAHCDQVTVLRGGENVLEAKVASTSTESLTTAIVGRKPEKLAPTKGIKVGSVALSIRGLQVRGYRGNPAVERANLEINAGEILGIVGVDGNGQRELFDAILGIAPYAGEMRWNAKSIDKQNVRERIGLGFRSIPEDRHAQGTIDSWSLEENAALGLQRLEPLTAGSRIDRSSRFHLATQIADRLGTKHTSLAQTLESLSGGNQQRLVAARALALQPKLILAFQPSRGLDLAATRRLYEEIHIECTNGAAALIVSFDLDEMLQYADRIGVMFKGQLRISESRDRHLLGRLMVGANE